MIKRIVIAGSRDYNNYEEAKEFIDFCIQNIKIEHQLVFVSGCCYGADALGERYAKENGFAVKGLEFSPVKGPEGNIEYLLYIAKSDGEDEEVSPEATVEASHNELDK